MAMSVFSGALLLLSISAVCYSRSVNIEKVSIEDDSPIASRKQAKFSGHLPYPLKLGAFNIKTFGKSKMSDDEVADYITQIVLRYDVILVQEIRDSSQESVIQLWRMVNSTRPYGLSISARLGRTSYKEQYAYFYRLDHVELIATLQYDDSKDDLFEREPYSVRFRPIGQTVTWDFALIGIHAKPDHAVEEIGALLDVYNDVRQTWRDVEDVVLMGDFNADCSYANKDDLQHLPIYNQGIFQWLIDFNVDTTTSTNTDCAYDRLVVSGDHIRNAVIPGSVDIYKYEDYLGLDNDRTRDVSDHYPVEFEIY